ncbi:MAG: hypothetical protein HWN68_18540 [Desulfobacterales bacterium]|nr:hypothetical protein [Desulfobacterales bacterium]
MTKSFEKREALRDAVFNIKHPNPWTVRYKRFMASKLHQPPKSKCMGIPEGLKRFNKKKLRDLARKRAQTVRTQVKHSQLVNYVRRYPCSEKTDPYYDRLLPWTDDMRTNFQLSAYWRNHNALVKARMIERAAMLHHLARPKPKFTGRSLLPQEKIREYMRRRQVKMNQIDKATYGRGLTRSG